MLNRISNISYSFRKFIYKVEYIKKKINILIK